MNVIRDVAQYRVTLARRAELAATLAALPVRPALDGGRACPGCLAERASLEGQLPDLDGQLRAFEATHPEVPGDRPAL
jgi:hypothetical protein